MNNRKTVYHTTKKLILLFVWLSSFSSLYSQYLNPTSLRDTVYIRQYLDSSTYYLMPERRMPDMSLYYLKKAQNLSLELDYTTYLYKIHWNQMELFSSMRNYPMALDNAFILHNLIEQNINDDDEQEVTRKILMVNISTSIIYFYLHNLDKAIGYLRQAEKLAIEASKEGKIDDFILCVIYANIGSVYLGEKDLDLALENYQKALLYNEKEERKDHTSSIQNNLGIIYMEKGEYDLALEYYNKSFSLREKANNRNGVAQVCNNIGRCYYMMKRYKDAIDMLNKGVDISRETGNYRSELIAISHLSMIYHNLGNYKQEAITNKRESNLKDSIQNQENLRQVAEVEAKYTYEKQRKQAEMAQQIMLAKKEKNVLISILVASFLAFSFFILFLLYRNLKIKTKKNKLESETLALQSINLELEKENLLLQNSKLEQEIESKAKELTTYVMYLTQKNGFILSITEKLGELVDGDVKQHNKQKIKSITRQMKANVEKTTWEEFEVYFQQIHKDFYNKLSEKIPNLTPNERRLCAFLYLNMSTKEISSITFQSIKSIEVARTRLRKKMDIDRDDNLVSVLHNL